jgi:hypothetical protein
MAVKKDDRERPYPADLMISGEFSRRIAVSEGITVQPACSGPELTFGELNGRE